MIYTTITTKDINDILELEYNLFSSPWSKSDFDKCVKNFFNIAFRHPATNKIIAYLFYSMDDDGGAEILTLAVSKNYQRQGLGTKLIQFVEKKFPIYYCSIRENNLAAQLFFKKMGLKCTNILRDVYKDCDELAYFFINKEKGK